MMSKECATMSYYVNEHVKSTERVFPMQGRRAYLRYDLNENPEGLPVEFIQEVLKEVTPEFLSIYPEPDRFEEKYAKFIDVERENVLTTNGSDMAIRYLMEVFGEPGKEVLTVSPSFEMYRINCLLLGLKHVPVSYENDFSISIEKIVDAINENTRIVALVNPNNPMGNVYTNEEMNKIVTKAHEMGAIVIVDEAYHYFYDKTFVDQAIHCDNVVVLRTFSKLMSIAACRLGMVISNPQIIRYVKTMRLTFEANSFALLFAEKLIERSDIINQMIANEHEGKEYLLSVLQANGYWCRNSAGNFLFVKPKTNAQEVTRRLKDEKRVLVHDYKNGMLGGLLRISIGSKAAMERFLKAFLEVDRT